jgi:hypothetical protein
MTFMGTYRRKLSGAGVLLAAALVALPALAQETGDEFEPAVNSATVFDEPETLEPAVDTSALPNQSANAPSAGADTVVAQDFTRRESHAGVMDEMTLERTEVTGNQELPKVLYIVPWQRAQPGELTGRPVNTLLDEVLAPLDREEFTRQVDYYGDLHRDE